VGVLSVYLFIFKTEILTYEDILAIDTLSVIMNRKKISSLLFSSLLFSSLLFFLSNLRNTTAVIQKPEARQFIQVKLPVFVMRNINIYRPLSIKQSGSHEPVCLFRWSIKV